MNGGTSKGGTAQDGGSNLHLKTGKTSASNNATIHYAPSVSTAAPVISGGEVLCAYNLQLGTFTSDATFVMNSTTKVTLVDDITLGSCAVNAASLDLAGNHAVISGTGTFTGYDSANEDFKTFGTLQLTGITLKNPGYSTVNEKGYYALEDNGTYSFHRLDVEITSVSLRPSIGGIYYTGKWNCDSTLAKKIDSFGVVVSTNDMPDNGFASEESPDSIWTVFGASDFERGVQKTGAMVSGILKDAADGASESRIALNERYANTPIFAAAYIVIDGDTCLSTGVSHSLFDVVKAIDEQIAQFPQHAQAMKDFLAYWKANGLTGEEWNFDFEPTN
jgi:hypothetical protein